MPLRKMQGDVPEMEIEIFGEVSDDLKPSNNQKITNSIQATYALKPTPARSWKSKGPI